MLKASNKFNVEVETNYDPKVLAAHHRLLTMQGEEVYDTKKNYPLQVMIRRISNEDHGRKYMYMVRKSSPPTC